MYRFLFRANRLLFLFLILPLLAACSNPADHDDDHDDHADAHGIRLVSGSTTFYQVLEGEVSCSNAPCGITLPVGQSLAGIEVQFLDEEGNEIHAEDLESNFTMSFSVGSPGLAVVEQVGRFGLTMRGVVAGTTAMQVVLNHDGHADLTTPPLSDANAVRLTVAP
ncbi:MAG: hypothetical protein O3C45_10465 [Bacteroidetes bacterium]|nr:hypothetical protein [Bacteroidota bacterium]